MGALKQEEIRRQEGLFHREEYDDDCDWDFGWNDEQIDAVEEESNE